MSCLVSGCNFLLKAITHEAFTFEAGAAHFVPTNGACWVLSAAYECIPGISHTCMLHSPWVGREVCSPTMPGLGIAHERSWPRMHACALVWDGRGDGGHGYFSSTCTPRRRT